MHCSWEWGSANHGERSPFAGGYSRFKYSLRVVGTIEPSPVIRKLLHLANWHGEDCNAFSV